MKNYFEVVDSQRQFFASGKTRDFRFRKQMLKKLLADLKENEKLLLEAAWKDLHKSEFETYATELGLVYGEIKLAINKVRKWSKPKRVMTNLANLPAGSFIHSEPFGVTLIIGSWNYPYLLTLGPLIGAMAAGNTIILKPSELTANCSSVLAQLLNEAFEAGYFHVVEGGIPETQELLRENFDYIFFTGSTRVGKIIYKAAAESLTPVTLELGGKSPCIIDRDANLKIAAKRVVWGKFINAGQVCIAPDYLLVHKDVKEKLLAHLKEYILKFYGENPQESSDYVRIGNQANFERLKGLIDHEKVYHGGGLDEKELFISPTILDNVTWDDAVMEDEIFGPILPVLTFDDFMDTVHLLKQKPKPLALYYFGNNRGKQNLIKRDLSFGGGAINDVVMQITNSSLPFGGVGHSGIGNYHGKHGYDTFSNKKSVLKQTTLFDVPLKYPPYKSGILKIVKKVL